MPDSAPEQVRFSAAAIDDSSAGYVVVDLATRTDWSLGGLSASGLSLTRETPPGSGRFESSVVKASGSFAETGRSFELGEADVLKLEGRLQTERMSIGGKTGTVNLLFRGKVDTVTAGPPRPSGT